MSKTDQLRRAARRRVSPLRKQLNFELKSCLGRRFFRNSASIEDYLHVGCGQNILAGFTNLDFYSHRSKARVFGHDLRYPLPFADGRFAGALSEHTLEHFRPEHASSLLKEIYRVLRPGAVFRCIVPDLGIYMRFYSQGALPGFEGFGSGCEAIRSLTQSHGHLSVWDEELLRRTLSEVGFRQIQRCDYRVGNNPDLLKDQERHRWESLYMEAVK
ncbi:MAG TPA: methyltransferase domain-containing protein [Stellaceae bacterium]|nr:methyltransferase domain-containing protein [Stellaceae bacterium]